MAIDASRIYWSNYSDATVLSVPLAGGTPSTLPISGSYSHNLDGIAVDSTTVYAAAASLGGVLAIALDGGTATPLGARANEDALAVVVAGGRVYWTTFCVRGCMGQVIEIAASGGGRSLIFATSDVSVINDIVADDRNLYWTTDDNGVVRASLSGGAPVTLTYGDNPQGLAVDGSDIYWVNAGSGVVKSIPIAGGTVRTIACDQAMPFGIAVDDTSVYWTNYGSGQIVRRAK